MRRYSVSLKIISYILIQAFIALDLCYAGAVINSADSTTLAPSMTINELDLQIAFDAISLNNEKAEEFDLEEKLEWESLESSELESEKMATDSVVAHPEYTASTVQTSNSNIINFEPVLPPPPKTSLFQIFSSTNLRNIFAFYPFNKKKLEEKLNYYGFKLINPEIDRKLLAYLLEVLEVRNNQFAEILKALNIINIGVKSAITKNGDPRSIEIENNTLYLSEEFLKYNLAVRIAILNDTISGLSDISIMMEYVDYDGQTKMATSRELGLSDSADDMLRDMRRIAADYTFPPYWYGFKKFMPYKTNDPGEFMRLVRPKGAAQFNYDSKTIGVSLLMLPDLVKLFEIAPSLWKELYESILAHEGGRKGHLMLWPLTNIEEIIQIFNWPRLLKKSAEPLIQNFVSGNWPEEVIRRGTPPLESWLPAATIFNLGLQYFGYNSNTPDPDGIIWKEYQANYGMVQEKGLRAVAIWFWWLSDFRKVEVNFSRERDHRFAFLSDAEFAQVLLMKEEIQKEYEDIKNGVKIVEPTITLRTNLKTILPSIGILLLGLITDVSAIGSTGAVVEPSGYGLDGVIIAGVITAFAGILWLWNKLPWGKSIEQRTVQLVDQVLKQYKKDAQNVDLIKLQKFYANSSFRDRHIIIDTIREQIRLKSAKINPEIFEPFFMNILEFGPKKVLQNLQSSVSKKMKNQSSDSLKVAAAFMNSSVRDALRIYNKRFLPQDRIDVKAVSFELSKLVVNLALSNTLHKRSVFVQSLLKNAALAKYINAEQSDKLYTTIVDEMPAALKSKDAVLSKIVESELLQLTGRINATEVATDITPHLSVSLSRLESTVEAEGFLQAMLASSKALQESSVTEEQLRGFFASINEKLINGVAIRVAFSDNYAVIKSEIEKLGLGLDADDAAITFLPVMVRAEFLGAAGIDYSQLDGDAVYQKFYGAVEDEIAGLRFAAVSALDDFSGLGMGTGRLVEQLKRYLRTEGTNISMILERKIRVVVKNLTRESIRERISDKAGLAIKPARTQDSMQPADRTVAQTGSLTAGVDGISSKTPVLKINATDIESGDSLSHLTLSESEMVESAI